MTAKHFSDMTRDERIAFAFALTCHRLLDINPECTDQNGCGGRIAAQPMLTEWRSTYRVGGPLPSTVDEPYGRMQQAYCDGRVCRIREIQHLARTFLAATVVQ